MKKGKSLRKIESVENAKSTNENTKNDDKNKSFKESKKIPEIPLIKRDKKIVFYINTNQEINNSLAGNNNQSKKFEKSKTNKNSKFKKIISSQKILKTLYKNKTEIKLEKRENKINKTEIKKKSPENSLSPSHIQKFQKKKKSILINISKLKKEKKNFNSQRVFQNSKHIKKIANYSKEKKSTIQSKNKSKKIQKIKNIKNEVLKNSNKRKRKLSYDLTYTKIRLQSKELRISKKCFSPKIKHYIRYSKEIKNNNLNKTFNITIADKNKLSIPLRNKSKDKSELLKKINKNKFIFSTLVYRNKGESMRDKLISLSNNKNVNSYTIPRNRKNQNSYSKNKTMDEFRRRHISIYQKNLNFIKERISTNNLNSRQTNTITREKNYLKTENYNLKNEINLNTNYNKRNINAEHNSLNKTFREAFNAKKSLNYLKLTVSAQNKMVNNKKEKKKNDSNRKIRSKTIEKDIKSIKRKYKNKNKYFIIHRNTISRFKIKDKNNINGEKNKISYIFNSNYATMLTTSRISNKKIDEYEIIKELGKGSYATVKLVIHKNNNNKYAMKIYQKKALLDPQKKNSVENEIKILKQLDNSNIMKLFEVIDTPKYLYLIMEYIDGISLLDTIKKETNHYFEEKRALKIFVQIIKANIYCQNKNICHRDLKLENILILKNDIIKLIDFGFAIKADKKAYQNLFCGSPSYMAPEIVNKQKYIAQYSDIWSLGVLFYSMLYGRFPFKASTQSELFKKINEAEIEFPDNIEINDKIKILLKKIFVLIPAQRPSLQEILNDILLLIN